MSKPEIIIIAAIDQKRGLGQNGQLLFRIKDDLRRFKQITTGHTIIMGRKTFDSIGKDLPNRTNIIITRQPDFTAPNCLVAHSLNEAINLAPAGETKIFIIGGGEIYHQAISITNTLLLTIIDTIAPADTYFPDYSDFNLISTEKGASDNITYAFSEFKR